MFDLNYYAADPARLGDYQAAYLGQRQAGGCISARPQRAGSSRARSPLSRGRCVLQGITSCMTLQKAAAMRVLGVKIVIVTGSRTSTLLQRVDYLPVADAYVCENGARQSLLSRDAPPSAGAPGCAVARAPCWLPPSARRSVALPSARGSKLRSCSQAAGSSTHRSRTR